MFKVILIMLIADEGKRIKRSQLEQEIRTILTNTQKTDDYLHNEYPFEVGVDVCCRHCKYGSDNRYNILLEKQERREQRIHQLRSKLFLWEQRDKRGFPRKNFNPPNSK